jgi:hypothetical protein
VMPRASNSSFNNRIKEGQKRDAEFIAHGLSRRRIIHIGMSEDEPDSWQLLAPNVTAWAHTAFPELRADRLYHQSGGRQPLVTLRRHSVHRLSFDRLLGAGRRAHAERGSTVISIIQGQRCRARKCSGCHDIKRAPCGHLPGFSCNRIPSI